MLRILIVDDYPDIAKISASILGAEHQVTWTECPLEAVSHVAHQDFDVLITDKNMPGIDGLVLARLVKRIHSETKVVMMSGMSCGNNPACVDFYICKPLNYATLNLIIQEIQDGLVSCA